MAFVNLFGLTDPVHSLHLCYAAVYIEQFGACICYFVQGGWWLWMCGVI
jgi:hypothetical protein